MNNQLTSVSSETTIQVNIQDTNTNPPTFDKPNYYVNVTEGLGIMATLPGLNMVITDKDLVSILITILIIIMYDSLISVQVSKYCFLL